MLITVAICTWNRAKLLDQTLGEMHKLEIPAGTEWELLIVNNNCTDFTDDVIGKHQTVLPIRRLSEKCPGLSAARNCAVSNARGDLLVWTDDDVLAAPNWLAEYVKAENEFPEAGFFGGPIEPWFEGRVPAWLEKSWRAVEGAFAVRTLADTTFRISDCNELPYGANFAIRTTIQRRHTYDTRLGRRAGSSISGEEVAVLEKILAEGITGRWVPAARVRHFVPESRQRIAYLRKFFFGIGQTAAITDRQNEVATLFGRPRWVWKQAVEAEVKYQLTRMTASSDVWLSHLAAASWAWGRLWGAPQQA